MPVSPPHLELHYKPDTDGTGEVFAYVKRKDYSGAGSAWFHSREIEEFGRLLAKTFPMPPNTEISLKGGIWSSGTNPPELQEVLLWLTVYPVGTLGTVGVRVDVMDGYSEGQLREGRAKLSVELLTDYQSIMAFGESTAQLVNIPGFSVRLDANAA